MGKYAWVLPYILVVLLCVAGCVGGVVWFGLPLMAIGPVFAIVGIVMALAVTHAYVFLSFVKFSLLSLCLLCPYWGAARFFAFICHHHLAGGPVGAVVRILRGTVEGCLLVLVASAAFGMAIVVGKFRDCLEERRFHPLLHCRP